MDRQKCSEGAFKEAAGKDHIEVFPKGPLGPILGAPKQYEPPGQSPPRSYDGDRLSPNGQIFDDKGKTNKAVY